MATSSGSYSTVRSSDQTNQIWRVAPCCALTLKNPTNDRDSIVHGWFRAGKLGTFPMREELLALPAEARPSMALGGCDDSEGSRQRGESCTMLLRAVYQWMASGYRVV